MRFINPKTITSTMIGAGTTIAEDTTTAWVSGTYAVGDERHLVATHRVYRCAIAGASTLSPELDPTRWVDVRPTNRFAPFDSYTSTAAKATTTMTYVLNPGYFNALAIYGLVGSTYTITIKDTSGGTTIFTTSGFMYEDPIDWYEYLYTEVRTIQQLKFTNLPIRPAAELTVTLDSASGQPVALGMLVLGDLSYFVGSESLWGGPQWGASAEPITYSYIKTAEDGTTTIVRRNKATNLRVKVTMPSEYADSAILKLQSILDIPVAWLTTDIPGYAGLDTFGLCSSSPVTYESYNIATIDLNIKGLI